MMKITEILRNPSLTPALRIGGKIYPGGHSHGEIIDSLPKELTQHLRVEDYGFLTAERRWLSRTDAFEYALQHDLLGPRAPRHPGRALLSTWLK